MSYGNIKITLKAAQGYAFPHCNIRDRKATQGNYQATLFGTIIVDPSLNGLCTKLADELYRLAKIGHHHEING